MNAPQIIAIGALTASQRLRRGLLMLSLVALIGSVAVFAVWVVSLPPKQPAS